MMILDVELSGNRVVSLEGSKATYWQPGLPVFKGKIEDLPEEVIQELIALGAIKKKD